MKKFFVLLFGLIILILLIGGCQNLGGFFPFLNRAPVIISEPITTAKENQLYSYQVEVSDPDGDILNYFLTLKPEGMSINSENGLITWTPTNNQVGAHQVMVEISDRKYNVQQSFEIEVANVNDPPQILSYFPINLSFEINEGDSVKFEVQAHDIDLNTILSYQWFLNGKLVLNSSGLGNNSKSSWQYSSDYGDCGTKTVKVLVSDGEFTDNLQWKITVNDITPPGKPTLNTVISPTNIFFQILSGTKEANSSIWINGAEVVPLNSSTDWSYIYNLLEGNNNISITSHDAAGNESLTVTATIILDTIAPEAPTLNKMVSPTNISPQILSGTKEVNTSIWINGSEVVPLNSSTDWSYIYNLLEGNNNISITSRDAAGNESSTVTATIILDTIAPARPTLDTVVSPTNISPQILSGTKEVNTSIWINGSEVVPLNSSNEWSYIYNLLEGNNNISITSRDAIDNESSEVAANIILDTIAPTTSYLNAVTTPTNISIQILSGTKEANTSIWINGIESVPLDSSINWSYSFELTEGENNISIISKDNIGNESNEITATIILDTYAPAIPSLEHITYLTNVSPQVLSGTKEANTAIWINGVEAVLTNSDTTWSYAFDLSEGNNNISITSHDAAGNESLTVTATIILDTIAPEAPTLNKMVSPTNISPQILSGTKEVNTSIWINGSEVVPLNSFTEWSYSIELIEGNNNISITSRDSAGNESSPVTAVIEYDLNIYVDAGNSSGIEDGTKTHPFNTISEGIEAVPAEKSVIVSAGTYNELLLISKVITLQGESRDNTFITGSGLTGNLITLEADHITITGFTIDGGNKTSVGIYFNGYSSININNNLIKNNSDYGINYSNSAPTIEDNYIESNSDSGIDIGSGGAGIIRNNFIITNQYGIRTCSDSSPEISNNDICNNSNTGIYCRESATPIISYNTINNNSYCGILIDNVLGDAVNPDIGNEYPSGGNSPGGNIVTGNTNYGIYNKTNHLIKAENNWWGDTAGPKYPGNPNNAVISSDWAYWSKTGGDIDFDLWLYTAP